MGGGAVDEELFLKIYPVGCIYMSANNVNPKTLFGGEWVEWGSGRVPVGINGSDTRFSTTEQTGGAYTAALGIDHMPAHNHGNVSLTGYLYPLVWGASPASSGIVKDTETIKNKNTPGSGSSLGRRTMYINASHTHTTQGKGSAFSIIQPYITCYMWKRIA